MLIKGADLNGEVTPSPSLSLKKSLASGWKRFIKGLIQILNIPGYTSLIFYRVFFCQSLKFLLY